MLTSTPWKRLPPTVHVLSMEKQVGGRNRTCNKQPGTDNWQTSQCSAMHKLFTEMDSILGEQLDGIYKTENKMECSIQPAWKAWGCESCLTSLPRENIGRHTWAVVHKFFVERTVFTKSLMSTKKQLKIIVNKKRRTWIFNFLYLFQIQNSIP